MCCLCAKDGRKWSSVIPASPVRARRSAVAEVAIGFILFPLYVRVNAGLFFFGFRGSGNLSALWKQIRIFPLGIPSPLHMVDTDARMVTVRGCTVRRVLFLVCCEFMSYLRRVSMVRAVRKCKNKLNIILILLY